MTTTECQGFIEVVSGTLMRCTLCGNSWSPELTARDRLANGTWVCYGCGADSEGQIDPHLQTSAVLAALADGRDLHV
jgi:hypothetical protein